jgi:Flp pilus assembly protein TadD
VALWSDTARKSPGKGRPHANLAEALIHQERTEDAIPELLQAIHAGGPTLFDAGVHGDLATALFRARRLDEARVQAEAAIEADPAQGTGYNTLGLVMEAQGDDAAAAAWFRRTTELAPVNPAGWLNLARALDRLRDPAACAAWARYLALEPDPAPSARARHLAPDCP